MVIGMAAVLLFLSLMIVLINLVSHATRKITARELELIEFEKKERATKAARKKNSVQKDSPPTAVLGAAQEDNPPIAVFAAAIAAYETDNAPGQ